VLKYDVEQSTTKEDLIEIGKFRYKILVQELGVDYVGADHQKKVQIDELDSYSTNFYVKVDGNIIGVTRTTILKNGPIEDPEFFGA